MQKDLIQVLQHFTNIPNNPEGKEFIRLLRKYVTKNSYKVAVRGRGHRFGIRSYKQDLPIRLSTSFAVTLHRKPDPMIKRRTKLEKLYVSSSA